MGELHPEKRESKAAVSPPSLVRRLRHALQNYGGFVLGAFTVPFLFAYFEPYHLWIQEIRIPRGMVAFPSAWWWAPVIVNSILTVFVSPLLLFGPCVFLGGLVGQQSIRAGLLICLVLMTIVLLIEQATTGGYQLMANWLSLVLLPLCFFAFYLGAMVPYLLGFSLRRLVFLFVSASR